MCAYAELHVPIVQQAFSCKTDWLGRVSAMMLDSGSRVSAIMLDSGSSGLAPFD